ncbi:metallophosphoesterase [Pseudoxanthomonas sp. PXM02]|uniref:metallophosphoesterase n=1 Tax=Pseudoxanthomonas sp. PXM02 TaxID=2769294 RepID=UPI00177C6169|nr:metallophosphoesterase [Pseudoxanthomonas sp. PXM02]MBD9477468.1 metallophosphoesterase family protein [Pseudoxanthomonas sp. PXM02]
MDKLLIKQCLFYGSWLAWPMIVWLVWRLRERRGRWLIVLLLAGCLLFAWARFVEPQRIRVQETVLSGTGAEARLALISDIHLGVYKDRAYLQRLVDRINSLPVDALVIAGDFTYEPGRRSLRELFSPLAELRRPVYAVLGNHDQQAPGPDIDKELRAALAALDVDVIEGGTVTVRGFRLAGLGDRWAGKDDPAFLATESSPTPTLVLTHNPDSAIDLGPDTATLVLAGHTHGGQIRIPWLYRHVIPSRYGFDRGEQFLQTPQGRVRVYTTVGTGEIGLPMRLFNPPTIDVLDLRP